MYLITYLLVLWFSLGISFVLKAFLARIHLEDVRLASESYPLARTSQTYLPQELKNPKPPYTPHRQLHASACFPGLVLCLLLHHGMLGSEPVHRRAYYTVHKTITHIICICSFLCIHTLVDLHLFINVYVHTAAAAAVGKSSDHIILCGNGPGLACIMLV